MPERLHGHADGQDRRRESHADEEDHDRGRGHRRRRMQYDAERAVVGCGLNRMDVRDLGESEQGEQDQAHQNLCIQDARIGAAMPAGLEPRSYQRANLTS